MKEAIKRRWQSLSDAAFALSLANLCFMRAWFGLLFTADHDYQNKLPVTRATLLALACNILLGGLLFWRLGRWVRSTQSRFWRGVAGLAVCALLLIPFDFARHSFLHANGSQAVGWFKHPLAIVGTAVLLVALWKWPRLAFVSARSLVIIFVPLVFLAFGKLVAKWPGAQEGEPPRRSLNFFPLTNQVAPRVVWIIFDELDQRVAFEARPAACRLPALDRLCAESLFATNSMSAGPSTITSIPALTMGRYVTEANYGGHSELNLTMPGQPRAVGWSTQATVFSRSRDLGRNTAVVGWYHPYGRLFDASLNFCSWYPLPSQEQERAPTFLGSAIQQLESLVSILQRRQLQIELYRNSLADARLLVKDSRYGMVMLHLMGPHYPGIYDPDRDQFTRTSMSVVSGYFNNLVLTDKTLAILRRDMEDAGVWDRTWILVSSDHCWREADRYDGRIDPRVPFILKASGKSQPVIYGDSMNTVVTHDLILAILRGELHTTDGAVSWLRAHPSPLAPACAGSDSH